MLVIFLFVLGMRCSMCLLMIGCDVICCYFGGFSGVFGCM